MNTGRRRRILLGLAITVAAAGVGHAPTSAKQKVNSFEGSCSFEGIATFSPPVTNTPQRLSTSYTATGSCTGTLDGTTLTSASVTLHQAVSDVIGACQQAKTTRPGRGAITFADGTTVAYTFEFDFPTPVGTFTFRGERAGSAHGAGSLLTPRTPSDVAARCAGAGVTATPLDMTLTTESPLVSRSKGRGRGH